MQVYLCGPIEGLPPYIFKAWREETTRKLVLQGILTKDPTRRLAFNAREYDTNLSKGTVAKDLNDIRNSNLVLANLKDRGGGLCWGSVSEITLAHYLGIPVITILEEGFHHPFIETFSTELYHDLDSALVAVREYAS